MANQPHVLLLGASVLMDSVAESLTKQEFTNVIRSSSNYQETMEFVNSLHPDLIVYELNSVNVDPILSIIRDQTDTSHLAIDMNCNQVILLDCQRKQTESMQELCDLVSHEVKQKSTKKEVQAAQITKRI